MENTNIKDGDLDVKEKLFMLICRYWRKEDKDKSKDGQVYFILTSTERDKIFSNIMERLCKEEEIYNWKK